MRLTPRGFLMSTAMLDLRRARTSEVGGGRSEECVEGVARSRRRTEAP
jgi:hypothetical protein